MGEQIQYAYGHDGLWRHAAAVGFASKIASAVLGMRPAPSGAG